MGVYNEVDVAVPTTGVETQESCGERLAGAPIGEPGREERLYMCVCVRAPHTPTDRIYMSPKSKQRLERSIVSEI